MSTCRAHFFFFFFFFFKQINYIKVHVLFITTAYCDKRLVSGVNLTFSHHAGVLISPLYRICAHGSQGINSWSLEDSPE